MKSRPIELIWDVVVIDATGKLGEHGYSLYAELMRRGLRVKLNIVPALRASAIPDEVLGHAQQSRYLVTLMTIEEEAKERPGVQIKTTAYIGVPTAQIPGELPKCVPGGSPGGYVETGRLPRDLQELADRIASRIRPSVE